MKLNKYVESLEQSDPDFRRSIKEWSKFTPPKRKVKLFLDRNLPEELNEEIKAYHRFKAIGIAGENDSDEFIWHAARSQKAIILSLDKGDFWNDKKFPLQLSPGVILISAREQSVDAYIRSLTRLLLNMDIIGGIRRYPDFLEKMKFKVSNNGFVHKFITRKGAVEILNIEYD